MFQGENSLLWVRKKIALQETLKLDNLQESFFKQEQLVNIYLYLYRNFQYTDVIFSANILFQRKTTKAEKLNHFPSRVLTLEPFAKRVFVRHINS